MVVEALESAMVVTAFVAVMMLIVEYINVRSRWQTQASKNTGPTHFVGTLHNAQRTTHT